MNYSQAVIGFEMASRVRYLSPNTIRDYMGHTTLDRVRIYLQIGQTDVDTAHRKASPVDHMHL